MSLRPEALVTAHYLSCVRDEMPGPNLEHALRAAECILRKGAVVEVNRFAAWLLRGSGIYRRASATASLPWLDYE